MEYTIQSSRLTLTAATKGALLQAIRFVDGRELPVGWQAGDLGQPGAGVLSLVRKHQGQLV